MSSRWLAQVDTVVVGACVAVVAFVAGWAVVLFVEVVAGSGNGLSFLPPPVAIRVPTSVGLAILAIAGGLVMGRRRASAQRRSWAVPSLSALLAVGLVGGIGLSAQAYNQHHEKEYLARLAGVASQRVLLRDGHQACDWLTNRRWGGPPARQADLLRQDTPSHSAPFDPGRSSHSTARLYGYYVTYVDRQRPGPLVGPEVLKARIAMVAWFDLCPFQQEVHRAGGE
jgi:uncharacterized membrane protein YsdA (DUF1294 family)